MTTQGKHDFKYGKFEIRAKVPAGQGLWPAFWMMPTSESLYGQWPKCGEIDIMEILGHEPNKTYGTIHYGDPHNESQGTYVLENGTFADDYHTYSCEWVPGEIRFYVDGILIHKENEWYTKKEGYGEVAYPAPFDQPFYLQMNLAVGGSWPGNPDETTDFSNAKYMIDYVKVYQLDSYDENVAKPEVVLRDPDATGNYVVNGDFAVAERLDDEKDWGFLTAADGVGNAEIKAQALRITMENAGTENHSIQIVQPEIPMEIGYKYRLTFDASAEAARTMIVDVSAPKKSWIRYFADTSVELTTEKQSYSYEFDMTKASDAYGRLEFNLGNQGSTAAVTISSVRLEKIGTVEISDEKTMLPDGNYVYNGEFQEGTDRLAYWTVQNECAGAKVSVTNQNNERELKAEVPESVTDFKQVAVTQDALTLTAGVDYVLSLDAYADKAKTIRVSVAGQEFDADIGTEKTNYKFKFTAPNPLSDASVSIYLGTAGTTYVDNVRITEDSLIVNGDFSNGTTGFTPYVYDSYTVNGVKQTLAQYWVDSLEEDDAMKYEIFNTGDQDWYIQLKQENVTLEKGKWYKISFKIKSSIDRAVRYAMQHDGNSDPVDAQDWTVYNGADINVTSDYQTYTNTFQMTGETDTKTNFTISMGKITSQITEKHYICIDDIVLEETEKPAEEENPGTQVEVGTELIKNGDFAEGDANWIPAVNMQDAATYRFSNGAAVFDIANVGTANWTIQLKQSGLVIEPGATYHVEVGVSSSVTRKIEVGLMGDNSGSPYYGGGVFDVTADEAATIRTDIVAPTGNPVNEDAYFALSLGQVGDETTPAGTVTITRISITKTVNGEVTGGGNEGGEGGDETTGTDLIQNGDFALAEAGWSYDVTAPGEGSVDYSSGNAVCTITNVGDSDWNLQLNQSGITLEKGAAYQLKLRLKSDTSRTVLAGFQNASYAWYGGATITLNAGEWKDVDTTFTVTNDTDADIKFYLSIGKITGEDTPAGTVEVESVSLVKQK